MVNIPFALPALRGFRFGDSSASRRATGLSFRVMTRLSPGWRRSISSGRCAWASSSVTVYIEGLPGWVRHRNHRERRAVILSPSQEAEAGQVGGLLERRLAEALEKREGTHGGNL